MAWCSRSKLCGTLASNAAGYCVYGFHSPGQKATRVSCNHGPITGVHDHVVSSPSINADGSDSVSGQ